MFVRNDLAEGRFRVEGRAVAIGEIATPIFAVGTETDHVAPWHSVHKIHLLNPGDLTFVLTSGGHNAGIVSEPGHPKRHFRLKRRAAASEPYLAPEEWLEAAQFEEGSWWPAWAAWLKARSGRQISPPPMGAALGDAPGRYVHEH
jgi:polyhydroxyalkanoate synthase